MHSFIKTLIRPYHLHDWQLDLIRAIPQITSGILLTFYYAPLHMGVPWKSGTSSLPAFEVSPVFVENVRGFGTAFSSYPTIFAYVLALSIFCGGICLMLGFCTRMASFFIFMAMLMLLLFREFDQSWSYVPLFAFMSIGILGVWFGSGRFGLDYLISKKFNWS